jgi:hypothetical protein
MSAGLRSIAGRLCGAFSWLLFAPVEHRTDKGIANVERRLVQEHIQHHQNNAARAVACTADLFVIPYNNSEYHNTSQL